MTDRLVLGDRNKFGDAPSAGSSGGLLGVQDHNVLQNDALSGLELRRGLRGPVEGRVLDVLQFVWHAHRGGVVFGGGQVAVRERGKSKLSDFNST